MKYALIFPLWIACATAMSPAAELFVDASAAEGGDGSAAKPLRSIAAAVKASSGSDTITVRKGTYSEVISISKSGTAEAPTVLRAAAGDRVVVSGFAPIGDWKDQGNGVYTTVVKGAVGELFVGLHPQPVSRWPELSNPMRRLVEPDPQAKTFKDSAPLTDFPAIKEIAAAPKSLMTFIYNRKFNGYSTKAVTKVDLASGLITVDDGPNFASLAGKEDRFQLINHPLLISRPGHWAFETLEDQTTRVYFRPVNPDDLTKTQYRPVKGPLLSVAGREAAVSHVRVEGIEVRGGGADGISVRNVENVTITGCIADFNGGFGIMTRRTKDLTVAKNLVVGNGYGVTIGSATNALVEENEIASNMVDGLLVVGNASGKPDAEPNTDGVMIRRNYVHHHLLLAHPDNFQSHSNVSNLKLDSNVLTWAGQGMMTEMTTGGEIRNTVVIGTSAVAVIFGHGNSENWTVENSTVGLGGWGAFSLTAGPYRLKNNVVYNNAIIAGTEMTSSNNLFYFSDPKLWMFRAAKPAMTQFSTPADVAAALKLEEQSVRTDQSPFRNAPVAQGVAPWDDKNTTSKLILRKAASTAPPSAFTKGDRIEINGDHVVRTVTAVNDDSIEFAPPLPERPFRDSLIWNWKAADSFALDLRPRDGAPSPAGAGQTTGSNVDIPAYERGDFNGDGKRDIPEIPADLKEAWPNPNNVVLPVKG